MFAEEEKIMAGEFFSPADPELKSIKLRTHNLCVQFNQTFEDEVEKRAQLLQSILGRMGENSFIQGPVFIHYGSHTSIGKNFFGNWNLTIQDDALVSIGDDCDFGPGVTIVTPLHPIHPEDRQALLCADGQKRQLCCARPVHIGNHCWLGANVTVCPGVVIGDNCVIGAGSVVTRSIPANSLAVGVPCRVIRTITDKDRLSAKPR